MQMAVLFQIDTGVNSGLSHISMALRSRVNIATTWSSSIFFLSVAAFVD